jgi:hypothetical protein
MANKGKGKGKGETNSNRNNSKANKKNPKVFDAVKRRLVTKGTN